MPKPTLLASLTAGLLASATWPAAAPPALAADGATIPADAELRARYALPQSRFIDIAGEPLHYTDEGRGPTILLLHGSYASLRQWDEWAKVLKRHYRVIRIDQSPAGLSGPSADYSLRHKFSVIDALMDRLGVKRFVMVGTSSSGLPAAAYAAARPERITGVVLANIAVGRPNIDFATMPDALKAAVTADAKHPTWHSTEFWRQILLHNITDKSRVTPELAQRWTDLNNRFLHDPSIGKAAVAEYDFSRTPGDLRKITAPVLLLWGADDHESSVEDHGIPALRAIASEDKALEVLPACGHMLPLDCPARALERVLPFLKRVAR